MTAKLFVYSANKNDGLTAAYRVYAALFQHQPNPFRCRVWPLTFPEILT